MRIFISSTSVDLAEHRRAVIGALLRSGHTPVCMEHRAAGSVIPKDECLRQVAACELYVGFFAWRYGFIPAGCDCSITELEYREAERLGKTTLIFLLDESAEWPAEYRDGGENGRRIQDLRERLRQDKWIRFFTNPDSLTVEIITAIMRDQFVKAGEVTQEKKELTKAELERLREEQAQEKYERDRKGRDRIPIPVPENLVLHFQDRDSELSKLRQFLSDKNLRMAMICGRGGVGKTTLTVEMIRELTKENIVYVSLEDTENRSPDRIVELVARTQEPEKAAELRESWKQGDTSLRERLSILFGHTLSHHRCLIVLDNLESVLDNKNQIPQSLAGLQQFIEAFLEYDHAAKLIVTSRRPIEFSQAAEIAAINRRVEIPLDGGLPESYGVALLRELDPDGRLGILHAGDETLGDIVRRCECIPRTLESLVVTLKQHPTWTLETLLANETHLTPLLENPAREVYAALSSDQERLVLQTLAVYGKPVPLAAIRFVLPALPIDEILDKLFRNLVISFDPAGKRYWLHPLDQKYAYKQIPDQGKDYSKTVLHGLAAQFYRSLLCPPRGSRTSIDDVGPMLDAIGHLMDAEQAEEAVALFLDTGIDEDLHWWGHYLILTGLYERFLKCKISPKKKIALHIRFGKVHRNLGDLEKAQEIYESALPIISEAADPESEIGLLNALGDIAYYRSRSKLDLTPALKYLRRARDLLALNPHPLLQSENAGDLANVMYSLDEYEEAQHLYEQAIVFSKEAGNRIYEGIWHGDLGNVHSELMMTGTDKSAHQELAISYFHRAIAIAKETNDRRHESHWNGNLGNCYLKVGEYELAKAHLREALLISVPIHYGRMIPAQMSWLIATFDQHIQQCIQNRDIAAALKVGQSILQAAGEIGNAELEREAKRCIEALAPKDILNIFLLFQKGQVKEAVAESRKILASSEGKDETWAALAAIAMHWGRQSGQKDIFCLAAEAYSKLIGVSPDRPRQAPFLERANAHALSGNLEDAIDDYDEAMKQEPQNACASLSRAEVQIWAGRYGEARLSLEALFPALKTRADQVIGAWLMCHALNLEGRDFSEYKQVLMRKTEEDIGLDYGVRDIEPYIKELGRAIFSEEQIQNAWMLQSLIKRFAELCRCQ